MLISGTKKEKSGAIPCSYSRLLDFRLTKQLKPFDEDTFEIQAGRSSMTNKYEIIIYWSEEDQSFIAEVPELLGCMAH